MAAVPTHMYMLVTSALAQIAPEFARNITVFHVNPAEYPVAPLNMNTADLLGDM